MARGPWQVCLPPVPEAIDPGAGLEAGSLDASGHRHFQIGDGLHLKLRKQNCAVAGQSVVQLARLRDPAVPSAVAPIAGKSAAPLCHANESAGVLALEPIRGGLQAHLAVAPVA